MQRSVSKGRLLALSFLVGSLILGAAVVGVGALEPPDENEIVQSVLICHRTNSNQNPYIINEPDASGDVSGHADHVGDDGEGPIWNPTLKALHIEWGDIIPPFKYGPNPEDFFEGLNWTAQGELIYANDCNPILPPPEVFGTLAIVKAVVNPESPDVPDDGYTIHVVCDDLVERDDIVIGSEGNVGDPVLIEDIEAGSTCVVSEVNPPAGSTVSFSPDTANTGGVLVDEFVDDSDIVTVTITNTFTLPGPAVAPATAVVTQPAFTG